MALRWQVFATMMVGNILLMGTSLVCKDSSIANDVYPKLPADLCTNSRGVGTYALVVLVFVLGSFAHGALEKAFRWPPRTFALLSALCIIVVAFSMSPFGADVAGEVFMFVGVLGMISSVSDKCEISAGDMLGIGYSMSSFLKTFDFGEIQECFTDLCSLVSLVTGVCMGVMFHTDTSLVASLLLLSSLILAATGSWLCEQAPDPDKDILQSVRRMRHEQRTKKKKGFVLSEAEDTGYEGDGGLL